MDSNGMQNDQPMVSSSNGHNEVAQPSGTKSVSQTHHLESLWTPRHSNLVQGYKMSKPISEAFSELPLNATAFWTRDRPSWGAKVPKRSLDTQKKPNYHGAKTSSTEQQSKLVAQRVIDVEDQSMLNRDHWRSYSSIVGNPTSHGDRTNNQSTEQDPILAPGQARSFEKVDSETNTNEPDAVPSREVPHSKVFLPEYDDCFQMLSRYIRQREEVASTKHDRDRESLRAELEEASANYQALQAQVATLQQNKASLTSVIEDQKKKITVHESKVLKFKTFVDGLGKDFDSLKREANSQRQKGEDLTESLHERKAEQAMLLEQISKSAEESSALKEDTLNSLREVKSELDVAKIRCSYLEKQLHDNAGLLAEERDFRAKLQSQLTSSQFSGETVVHQLKLNNVAILDKLCLIHTEIETGENHTDLAEMLDAAAETVQNLGLQQMTAEKDITAIKDLLQALSESFAEHRDTTNSTHDQAEASETLLKSFLAETLNALKTDLSEQERLIAQEASQYETIAKLQQELQTCNQSISEGNLQLSAVQVSEGQLKSQNCLLQTNISSIEKDVLPRLRNELQTKTATLEKTKSELLEMESKLNEEIGKSTDLQNRVDSLKQCMEESTRCQSELNTEREQLKRETQEMVDKARVEISERAKIFHAEQESKMQNQLRRLNVEREDAENKAESLRVALDTATSSLQDLKNELQSKASQRAEEMKTIEQTVQKYKEEIKNLQTSLEDAETASTEEPLIMEKYNDISSKYKDSQTELASIVEQKSRLVENMEHLRAAAEESSSKEAKVKELLENEQHKHKEKLVDLMKNLKDANETIAHFETDMKSLKTSYNAAIDKVKVAAQSEVNALQQRIAELQTAGKKENDSSDWENNGQAEKPTTQAISSLDEPASNYESKESETTVRQKGKLKRSDTEKQNNVVVDGDGHTIAKPSTSKLVSTNSSGITPPNTDMATAPEKPHKRLHQRTYNAFDQATASLPGFLRNPGTKPGSIHDNGDDHNDDMLDLVSQASQVSGVATTQSENHILSFAAFNARLSVLQPLTTKLPGVETESQGMRDGQTPTQNRDDGYGSPDNEHDSSSALKDVVEILNSQPQSTLKNRHLSSQTLDQSQAPPVIGCSSFVHFENGDSLFPNDGQVHEDRGPGDTRKAPRMKVRLETPRPRSSDKKDLKQTKWSQHSSSPDFIRDGAGGQEDHTHQVVNEFLPLSRDFGLADNLAKNRPASFKRKARVFETVEYEHKKTKRVYSRTKPSGLIPHEHGNEPHLRTPNNGLRSGLRATTSSAVNRKNSQTALTPSTTRPFTGSLPRPSRKRKLTKGEEMNARFSQELGY